MTRPGEQAGACGALGWATAEEIHGSGRFESFERGAMIWLSQRGGTYVFFDSNYTVVNTLPFP